MKERHIPNFGVKEAAFPFNMFPEVDPVLGPEMRSTGEVLGMSKSYGEAFFKAQEGVGSKLPQKGTVLISVNDRDKAEVAAVAKIFEKVGFDIIATGRTYDTIVAAGIKATKVKKLSEGRPNVGDMITNGEVALVVNTPNDKNAKTDDSYLRKAAIKAKIPYVTTMAAAMASAEGILYVHENPGPSVKSLQEFHAEIQ